MPSSLGTLAAPVRPGLFGFGRCTKTRSDFSTPRSSFPGVVAPSHAWLTYPMWTDFPGPRPFPALLRTLPLAVLSIVPVLRRRPPSHHHSPVGLTVGVPAPTPSRSSRLEEVDMYVTSAWPQGCLGTSAPCRIPEVASLPGHCFLSRCPGIIPH